MTDTHFHDRVALVTGGAAGIGRAIVDRLAARGARVVVWDIDERRLEACAATHGERVLTQRVDIARPAAVAEAAETAAARWGGFSFLVNNAGIIGRRMSIPELDEAEIDRILAVNVKGMLFATQAFLAHADPAPDKAVVNLASLAVRTGGVAGNMIYAASKAAVATLTIAHAKELAPDIRVNALAPGIIDTEIQKDVYADPAAMTDRLSRIALGRAGRADEVAALAAWLLSADASYVTGSIYDVIGGL